MINKTIDQLTTEDIEILNKFDKEKLNDFARSYWLQQYHNARIRNQTLYIHEICPISYHYANKSLEMMYETLNTKIEDLILEEL